MVMLLFLVGMVVLSLMRLLRKRGTHGMEFTAVQTSNVNSSNRRSDVLIIVRIVVVVMLLLLLMVMMTLTETASTSNTHDSRRRHARRISGYGIVLVLLLLLLLTLLVQVLEMMGNMMRHLVLILVRHLMVMLLRSNHRRWRRNFRRRCSTILTRGTIDADATVGHTPSG